MEICSVRHSSALFTIQQDTKEFVTERSTLDANSEGRTEGAVFNDSADLGFIIVSTKTNEEATFAQCRKEYDNEGDLLVSHYSPSNDTLRRLPHLKDWSVAVLND
ncbi:hypothetical protein E4H12_05255 [Candidatus Thorarchaeota archaeon]|nr:MAG: hypothetical protein E4H12_05255 [Candidatus Thorarchaeota archaeon]